MQEISHKKANPKNRVEPVVEEAVVAMARDYPDYGQLRASNELKKRGVFVSPCGVRSIWLRHGLETFKKRLQALEQQLAANSCRLGHLCQIKSCLLHLHEQNTKKFPIYTGGDCV